LGWLASSGGWDQVRYRCNPAAALLQDGFELFPDVGFGALNA